MKPSTKDKAKGKFHEVKGKVKEKVGRATNKPDLEAEGQGEKIGERSKRKSPRWRKFSENSAYGPDPRQAGRGRFKYLCPIKGET